MLQIAVDKIAHVIIRARDYESGVNPWAHQGGGRQHGTRSELHDFIAGLNEDEQASLVAVMWMGATALSRPNWRRRSAPPGSNGPSRPRIT